MVIQTTASYKLETFTYSNNLGDYRHIRCMGPIEKKSDFFKLDHICEYINQNNEKMWHRVNREGNQEADAGVGKGVIFDATGKYIEFIGVECPYAIKYLDNKNFSIHKCKLN